MKPRIASDEFARDIGALIKYLSSWSLDRAMPYKFFCRGEARAPCRARLLAIGKVRLWAVSKFKKDSFRKVFGGETTDVLKPI